MNKIKLTGFPPALWMIFLPILLGWMAGCSNNGSTENSSQGPDSASKEAATYTCPMHPQIVKNEPATCPVCGMDLVPFDKNNKEEWLTLGSSQRALANITTQVIDTGEFSAFTRLNGTLAADPTQTAYISARIAGRIENLYVKETGVPVKKGQPLYSIYSEELSTLQQEYLLASAQALSFPGNEKFKQVEKAARQKLLLYGQSASQLEALLTTRAVSPLTTFYAPHSGTVAELSVTEGQYVQEGGAVMLLESYQTLWVEAVIYPAEWNTVKLGQTVKVIIPGYEANPQLMTIRFLAPVLEEGAQLIKIRGAVSNPDLQWQPGLQAIVFLPAATKQKVLSLPAGAVIREGSGAHIWIETGPGVYEPRKVATGLETSGRVEITAGLKAGEKVVVSGAYLLYSEYVLKKGMHPVTGKLPPH